ncbi:SanA/YdcF family protein [Pollutibacter soli]|uniref:SanA/YdcF family protein n=1 Tax=Pollutibacter soli TaxID=3034157 RepID=UPI0030136B98
MFRKAVSVLVLLLIAFLSLIFYCDKSVADNAAGKTFSDVNAVPSNKVGLLLGTAKFLSNGYENYYYRYRIQAATELFRAGKIEYLIVSGDNSRVEYDEPTTMKSDLIAMGIDSTKIYLDYAGFRTFDSMIRAKEIFGQDSLTVISQAFHNERAIFISEKQKMTVVGYNAKDVSKSVGLKVAMREKLARVKVFLDNIFDKQPKFLGPRVEIRG